MEFHKLLGRNPVPVISGEPARDCKWDLNRSFVGFLRFHNCSVLCIGFYLCAQTLVAVLRVEDRGKGKYLKTHEPAMSGSFSGAAGRPVPCEELH